MKTKLVCGVLMIFALLTGCVSTADKLNDIHIGMTRADVVAHLGQPDSTSAQGNIEYLTYYLSNDVAAREQPYSVRMVDQKVESFGRFLQLADIYNRPVNGSAPMGSWAPGMMPSTAMMTVQSSPMPAAATPSAGLVQQLQALKQLHDQNVLTDDEFQRAKQKLLADPR